MQMGGAKEERRGEKMTNSVYLVWSHGICVFQVPGDFEIWDMGSWTTQKNSELEILTKGSKKNTWGELM